MLNVFQKQIPAFLPSLFCFKAQKSGRNSEPLFHIVRQNTFLPTEGGEERNLVAESTENAVLYDEISVPEHSDLFSVPCGTGNLHIRASEHKIAVDFGIVGAEFFPFLPL